MVTQAEALTWYNTVNGTAYATLAALGTVLAKAALKECWISKRREEGQETGQTESGAI